MKTSKQGSKQPSECFGIPGDCWTKFETCELS